MPTSLRFAGALCAGLFGALLGVYVGTTYFAPSPETVARTVPMPHHVPKHAGGLSLRLAMVHDVIHERFPAHGPAFYRERERLARERLAARPPDADEAFALLDDIGTGLDKLGSAAEAVEVLRDKLARQEKKGLAGRDLYTSYANLGTFLIHANMKAATAGDPAAKERVREGWEFIKKSIAVNPDAHFGREEWQAAIVEFLLAAADAPGLLKQFDFVGNSLAENPDPKANRLFSAGYEYVTYEMPRNEQELPAIDDSRRSRLRDHVRRVGGEGDWKTRAVTSKQEPVAFDEPVLGIIGMWREGGGANPHFALYLGEIMLRVGQRYIAWTAFERAGRLADRFHPKPELQQFLRDHCEQRQRLIENTLPPSEVSELRPRFEAELAHGQRYQREYQEYEAAKLAAGVPLRDPHFYDDFHVGREPIASPVGPEEWYVTYEPITHGLQQSFAALSWAAFGGGLAALLTARRLRPRPPISE